MKNTIIILIILIVAVVLFFSLSNSDEDTNNFDPLINNDQEENMEDEEESLPTTITYTDTGFEPAEINIDATETVIFQNQSSTSMWVASDPHPTHDNLPGFDQGGAGDEFEFTFNESGTWGFHNHSAPQHAGSVIVE